MCRLEPNKRMGSGSKEINTVRQGPGGLNLEAKVKDFPPFGQGHRLRFHWAPLTVAAGIKDY